MISTAAFSKGDAQAHNLSFVSRPKADIRNIFFNFSFRHEPAI